MTFVSSGAARAGYGLQTMLVAFPFVCFTLALLTDLAFWASANLLWQNFSAWLLFAGLVTGGAAVVLALLRLLLGGHARRIPWAFALGSAIVLVLALVNSFVHARDGWTAVVPTGLTLSIATVLLMIVTAVFAGFDRTHEGMVRHDRTL